MVEVPTNVPITRIDEHDAVYRTAQEKYAAIVEEIKASLAEEAGGWGDLFAPGMRYALLIGILLALFNNWTGWSMIGGYIPMLFEMSGLEDRAQAILQFAVTYGFMGLMTLVSLLLMDRVGRRPLWLLASVLMAAITFATGFVFSIIRNAPAT